MWIFRTSKLYWKKYLETRCMFWPLKLNQKNYVETTWIFRPSRLHQKKYVKTMWIFRPWKIYLKRYVETTWIFRPAKLHRKSKWKWRRNLPKFGLRRIDVIGRGVPIGLYYYLHDRNKAHSSCSFASLKWSRKLYIHHAF